VNIPFWIPALWIGATLALVPGLPWLTLLGYHALCLLAASRHGRPAWGRMPGWAWPALASAAVAALLILRMNHHSPALPLAGAQTFLADWPGGFAGYVGYTLTVNSICEETYWRHALPRAHPGWRDWQHGAAFGLHHLVANGLVFGWWSAAPAFLYTALGGWAAQRVTRLTGGIGLAILGHSLLNAMSFAWLAGRL
jgi:hypothetical protein